MKTLIIDRKNWSRNKKNNFLLLQDGTKDCLGFLAKSCGYEDKDILYRETPFQMTNRNLFPRNLFIENICGREYTSKISRDLMMANDDCHLSESERELKIKELFLKMNIDVNFIN